MDPQKDKNYYQVLIGMTVNLWSGMESERRSTLVATPPVGNIFINITKCIDNGAKKQTYWNTIGQSLE